MFSVLFKIILFIKLGLTFLMWSNNSQVIIYQKFAVQIKYHYPALQVSGMGLATLYNKPY